jgi:hypothetical protein
VPRVPTAAVTPNEGSGLGLAIAQRDIAINNGAFMNARGAGLIIKIEFRLVDITPFGLHR